MNCEYTFSFRRESFQNYQTKFWFWSYKTKHNDKNMVSNKWKNLYGCGDQNLIINYPKQHF